MKNLNDKDKFLEKLEKENKSHRHFSQFKSVIPLRVRELLFFPIKYPRYLLWRLGVLKTLNNKLFWGQNVVLNATGKFGTELGFYGSLTGESEIRLTKFLIKKFNENDIFYDVGANYGFYSYLALEFCKEIHLFEPLSNVFNNLLLNFNGKKNVFLNNSALSDKKANVFLYEAGTCSTISEESLTYFDKPESKIKIETITLDEYLLSHSYPTIIKIDVEGAEEMVIRGGYNFFLKNSPVVAIEVWHKNRGGEISRRAVELLRKIGYSSYRIDSNGEIAPISGDLSAFIFEDETENFIFIK